MQLPLANELANLFPSSDEKERKLQNFERVFKDCIIELA